MQAEEKVQRVESQQPARRASRSTLLKVTAVSRQNPRSPCFLPDLKPLSF
ncbi:MAG: hypothetical protein KME27_26700 [Lyngbya sp. HA4199-MV5]|nr:hypothetical protein [Lyngbya sp. HA4199-MV5]